MSAATGHPVDDALLWRIADAAAPLGFQAKRLGLGSSGMETCFSVSRDRVSLGMICCTLPEESDLSFWYAPPWFWQRWLRRGPTSIEVAEALEAIREVSERILGGDCTISDIRCVAM